MNEVVKSDSAAVASAEQKIFSDNESDTEFLERINNDPGFRFQLSELLKTYNISRYSANDLGYESRSFVEITHLIDHLNLEHLDEKSKNIVAKTVLGASLEVRDDLRMVFEHETKRDGVSPSENYAHSLPFSLQLVVIAKTCAGHEGGTLHPSALSAYSEERQVLLTYITQKFGYSEDKARAVIDTIATIHGAAILSEHFKYGMQSEQWRTLGTFPSTIVGRPAPRIGYHLPDNIEEALRTAGSHDLWRVGYLNADWHTGGEDAENKKFIDGMEWLARQAAELSAKPEHELPFWRAYIVGSMLANKAFEGQAVSGYSADYDQLVSWKEAKPDGDYWESYVKLLEDITKYSEACGELETEGVLLALEGAAIRIGHEIEQEIIYGTSEKRDGRLKVLSDILTRLKASNVHDTSELKSRLPLISEHIEELSDRWHYRFSSSPRRT